MDGRVLKDKIGKEIKIKNIIIPISEDNPLKDKPGIIFIDTNNNFKSVNKINSSKIKQEDYKSDKNEKNIILDNIIIIKKNKNIIDNKEK